MHTTTLLGSTVTLLRSRHPEDPLPTPQHYQNSRATICAAYFDGHTVHYDLLLEDGRIWQRCSPQLWRLGELDLVGNSIEGYCPVCGEEFKPGQQLAGQLRYRHAGCCGLEDESF